MRLLVLTVLTAATTASAYTPGDIVPDDPPATLPVPLIEPGDGEPSEDPFADPAGRPSQDPSADPADEPGDHGTNGEASPVPARAALSDVRYGDEGLPEPVARQRAALIAAARSGDLSALRPIFAAQRVAPIVAGFDMVEDAVEHLRLQSGDEAGREILAILLELLESGHVAVGSGSTQTYVWPYFAEVPLDALSPAQEVELYRILTAIDVEEMVRQGRYLFFRVGIAPDGRVRYFTAGDVE